MVFMPDEELVLHDGYFLGWNKILDQYCHLGNRVTDLQMHSFKCYPLKSTSLISLGRRNNNLGNIIIHRAFSKFAD